MTLRMKHKPMKSRLLYNMALVVATAGGALFTGFVLKRQLFAGSSDGGAGTPIANWAAVSSAGRTVGPANAPVRIVEFADYECTYCAMLQPTLDQVRAKHPEKVAVVYRHFPIQSLHRNAFAAAVAAECAGEQGRFETMHSALYADRKSFGSKKWEAFATQAGVPDLPRFRECLTSRPVMDRVDADVAAAEELHLQGTPALIINGRLRYGLASPEQLESWIQEAVQQP